MTNYIFVHGGNVSAQTWNEIAGEVVFSPDMQLGGKIWDPICDRLTSEGHSCFSPTLLDENKNNLSAHIKQIVEVIVNEGLNSVVLVGHSYGGMVITGVAACAPTVIAGLVYVDAALPASGQSLFDLLESAGLHPGDIITGRPQAYIEPVHYDSSRLNRIPKAYLMCTDSEFTAVSKMARSTIKSYSSHWIWQELAAPHLLMINYSDSLCEFLDELRKAE